MSAAVRGELVSRKKIHTVVNTNSFSLSLQIPTPKHQSFQHHFRKIFGWYLFLHILYSTVLHGRFIFLHTYLSSRYM